LFFAASTTNNFGIKEMIESFFGNVDTAKIVAYWSLRKYEPAFDPLLDSLFDFVIDTFFDPVRNILYN